MNQLAHDDHADVRTLTVLVKDDRMEEERLQINTSCSYDQFWNLIAAEASPSGLLHVAFRRAHETDVAMRFCRLWGIE